MEHPVTRAIRERVDAHEPHFHIIRWWPDGSSADCDAGEFWAVVNEAVRTALAGPEPRTGTWAQDVTDGTPTVRAGSTVTPPEWKP